MNTTRTETEIRRIALQDAENIARLFNLGTPDGHAIGDAIKKYADAEFRDDTTMNTGAASLSDEQILEHFEMPGLNLEATLDAHDIGLLLTGIRALLATHTPQVDAAIAAGGAQELKEPAVSLTGAQLLEAFQFVAPDHPNDADQLECEVTIQRGNGHDGPGLYCWITEYPEEGAIRLDADPAAASNGEQA